MWAGIILGLIFLALVVMHLRLIDVENRTRLSQLDLSVRCVLETIDRERAESQRRSVDRDIADMKARAE